MDHLQQCPQLLTRCGFHGTRGVTGRILWSVQNVGGTHDGSTRTGSSRNRDRTQALQDGRCRRRSQAWLEHLARTGTETSLYQGPVRRASSPLREFSLVLGFFGDMMTDWGIHLVEIVRWTSGPSMDDRGHDCVAAVPQCGPQVPLHLESRRFRHRARKVRTCCSQRREQTPTY